MNLKELSQIDIKNIKKIRFQDFKKAFDNDSVLIINVILVVLTIIPLIWFYYNNQKLNIKLGKEIVELEERIIAVDKFEDAKGQYDDFVDNFPGFMAEDHLRSRLSKLAIDRNIKIVSFSRFDKKSDSLIKKIIVSLDIVSDDYYNIVDFIDDIESISEALIVTKWSGKQNDKITRSSRNRSERTKVKRNINVKVVITSIGLKSE